jgi:hypothetical protein
MSHPPGRGGVLPGRHAHRPVTRVPSRSALPARYPSRAGRPTRTAVLDWSALSSQHARSPEQGRRRCGQVWRKLQEWQRRYLAAEIVGTVTAVLAATTTFAWTHSLAATAIAASIGETVGFYAVILCKTVPPLYRRHCTHRGVRRLWLTGRSAAAEAVDYAFAECADTLLVRPGMVYLASTWFASHLTWALLLGKVAADLGFYGVVIPTYELRKKLAA